MKAKLHHYWGNYETNQRARFQLVWLCRQRTGSTSLPGLSSLRRPSLPLNRHAASYRVLGEPAEITTVGFGCMITSDQRDCEAADLGITYFDTCAQVPEVATAWSAPRSGQTP
jgi:hypothetical protein